MEHVESYSTYRCYQMTRHISTRLGIYVTTYGVIVFVFDSDLVPWEAHNVLYAAIKRDQGTCLAKMIRCCGHHLFPLTTVGIFICFTLK